jgi:lambda repressor-like predicted transcriptional regulator
MATNQSNQNLTVEVAIELPGKFFGDQLKFAQDAVLAEFKAAGSDLSALATKAGSSVAFFQIVGARSLRRKQKKMGSLLDLVPGQPCNDLSEQGLRR